MSKHLKEIVGICGGLLLAVAAFFVFRFPWEDLLVRGASVLEDRSGIRCSWESARKTFLGFELRAVTLSGPSGRLVQFERVTVRPGWGAIHVELRDEGKHKGSVVLTANRIKVSLIEIPLPEETWPKAKGGQVSCEVEYQFGEESGKGNFQAYLPATLFPNLRDTMHVTGNLDIRGRTLEMTGDFESSQARGKGTLRAESPARGAALESTVLKGRLDGISGPFPFQMGIQGTLGSPEVKFSGGS
ncbi:MAG: hypothetical protein HYU64_12615 [Armatimonadetes bacterium]|nr:hypothetical protein [Armatimonadota bacterium]